MHPIAYVYGMKMDAKIDQREFDADDPTLISRAKEYADEDKAIALFESFRWPEGRPICPHCKHDEAYKLTSKPDTKNKMRKGVYCCAACRKTFTAKVGTVLEASHIPVSTWIMALFLICSSQKSFSAHQLHRRLKVTYKTAWLMAERIRFALGDDGKTQPEAGTVEVDETFAGDVAERKTRIIREYPVAALVQSGREVRARKVPNASRLNRGEVADETADKTGVVNPDAHERLKSLEYHGLNTDETFPRFRARNAVIPCLSGSFMGLASRES
jgi:transposase-like protein